MSIRSSSLLLAFFIVLTLSINSSTFVCANNATITDELIASICQRAKDSTFCREALKSTKGQSLSLAVIGSPTLQTAIDYAKMTADRINVDYRGTPTYKHQARENLNNCIAIYSVKVDDELAKANQHMSDGKAKSVKNCILEAEKRADSCRRLLKGVPDVQKKVEGYNAEFKKLTSIILAICDEVPKVK